jgi:hypothetical protein
VTVVGKGHLAEKEVQEAHGLGHQLQTSQELSEDRAWSPREAGDSRILGRRLQYIVQRGTR